jgi:uncharacterized protein (DUF983 family)
MSDPAASLATMVGRAVRRRCPRCGAAGIFRSYFELLDNCPECGVRFEREQGYWVGSMIIVTTLTLTLFIVLLVGGILLTWPEVPWGWLLGITIGANVIIPVLAYSRSKTLWVAFDLSWHPLEPAEIEAARLAVAASRAD